MNHTESFIRNFYYSLDIIHPHQLSVYEIASKINISIIYWPFGSEITLFNDAFKIFINENLNARQQWQDFGHEVGHYVQHVGSQTSMKQMLVSFQEAQAEYFSYHFCVPTFMLANLREVSIDIITRLFNVEYDFALRRLEMYQSKILSKGVHA